MRMRITACLFSLILLLSACGNHDIVSQESSSKVENTPSMDEPVLTAYSNFLSGDRTLLDNSQSEKWWIPDFQETDMEYEYAFLDLNGDGIAELLVQMADDPRGYNGVFHFEDDKLFCWNSDAADGSCWDYPLISGAMVRQFDFNGTTTYTIFHYGADGGMEQDSCLFAREELIPDNSSEPCPYYEINGEKVNRAKFEEQLELLITRQMLERSDWISN